MSELSTELEKAMKSNPNMNVLDVIHHVLSYTYPSLCDGYSPPKYNWKVTNEDITKSLIVYNKNRSK